MGNFEGSNRSSRWHWHQPRKGRCSDTDDHLLTWQQGLLGIFCAAWKDKTGRSQLHRAVSGAGSSLSSPRVCLTRRPGGRFTCSNACAVLELGFQRRCKAASVGGLFYPSLATAFLARRRIDFAAGLHWLLYRRKSCAVACRTFTLRRVRGWLFHCNLSKESK
jgi:hypothetical protein